MKKNLVERTNRYAMTTLDTSEKVIFSRTVPDARYKGYKYFFKYLNTHKVAEAFKTQKELSQFLEERGF